MALAFKRAQKTQSYLRMALSGPSGSGKTYTALALAAALAGDKPVAVVDTERGSASKYSDLFSFDVLELDSFHPDRYIEAIDAAQAAGYGVLVIDSITHEWRGTDGILAQVDRIVTLNKIPSIQAWAKATPMHNRFIDAMLNARLHLIVTMRSKMGVSVDRDERGKVTVQKVGMEAEQRDGIEYEFDVVGDLDHDNTLAVSKSRCPALSGQVVRKPGAELARTIAKWLSGDTPAAQPAPTETAELREDDPRVTRALGSLILKDLLFRLGMRDEAAQREKLAALFAHFDGVGVIPTPRVLRDALEGELAERTQSSTPASLESLEVGTKGN